MFMVALIQQQMMFMVVLIYKNGVNMFLFNNQLYQPHLLRFIITILFVVEQNGRALFFVICTCQLLSLITKIHSIYDSIYYGLLFLCPRKTQCIHVRGVVTPKMRISEYRALLFEYMALSVEYRDFLVGYRALFVELRAFSN